MPFELWARAQAKWRAILVYTLLQAVGHMVGQVIYQLAPNKGWQLYGSVTGLATSLYCFITICRLLMTDRDGDDQWPQFWP